MNKVLVSVSSLLLLLGCADKEPVYIEESLVKPCHICSKKQVKKTVNKPVEIQRYKNHFEMPYMKSVPFASSDENRMKKLVSELSAQLIKNSRSSSIKNQAMSISSFSSVDGVNSNPNLSAILSEYLIYEMQTRGHILVESPVKDNVKNKMSNNLRGTYSNYKNSVVINARIVDTKTDVVLSSAQVLIPKQVVNRITSNKGN